MFGHFSLVLIVLAGALSAAPGGAGEAGTLRLVLFADGVPDVELSDHRIERMTTSHNLWMDSLTQHGKVLIAGAVDRAAPLRHVALFDVGSEDEIRRMLGNDAAVRLRMLDLESYVLRTEAVALRQPKRHAKKITALLGFLRETADAPQLTAEELAEIDAGHRANLREMQETGDLVLAGTVESHDDLRVVLVFRGANETEIRRLVERDPAVKERRLALELYRWSVPRGSFERRPSFVE